MSEDLEFMLFTAEGCAPCKSAKTAMARLLDGALIIGGIVDVSDAPLMVADYGIQAVPTLVVKRGNDVVDRYVGSRAGNYLVALEKELAGGR